ncbi:DUF1214 domain-containing protein [Streptomyces hirsutus]|uniref:DUF1214 domain-containing protein n=1 Tax=Streptomyces hirsutus TaxID=35620 RepID=UPI00341AB31E
MLTSVHVTTRSGRRRSVLDRRRQQLPDRIGWFGDDFLNRAADQSLAGIVVNDPAEAVHPVNFHDANGVKLSANGRYELHFPPDRLPPVDAFWSMTAYSAPGRNLIPQPRKPLLRRRSRSGAEDRPCVDQPQQNGAAHVLVTPDAYCQARTTAVDLHSGTAGTAGARHQPRALGRDSALIPE